MPVRVTAITEQVTATIPELVRIDLPVAGMDCASCAAHIQDAVRKLPGVADVQVLVSAERATVTFDPDRVTRDDIEAAIHGAGYMVPEAPLLSHIHRRASREVWTSVRYLAGLFSG